MKAIKKIQVLLIAFLFVVPAAFAQVDYISVSDYMSKMKTDQNMVTLHTGKADDYRNSHIKGSLLVSYKETEKSGKLEGL